MYATLICTKTHLSNINFGNFKYKIFRENEVLHFTQFIHAKAKKIGCAASSSLTTYKGEEWRATWLACDYSFGNLLTRPVYIAGEPASACKTGNNKEQYPGLCNKDEQYESEQ